MPGRPEAVGYEGLIDARLDAVVETVSAGSSRLVVLIGDPALTVRAAYRAIARLPRSWERIWRPAGPGELVAGLHGGPDLPASWTVIWLEDLRRFLLPADPEAGEEAAAGVRALLADPHRTPVLVLATLPPDQERWRQLTQTPASGGSDRWGQARALMKDSTVLVAGAVTPRGDAPVAVPGVRPDSGWAPPPQTWQELIRAGATAEMLPALGEAAAPEPRLPTAEVGRAVEPSTEQPAGVPPEAGPTPPTQEWTPPPGGWSPTQDWTPPPGWRPPHEWTPPPGWRAPRVGKPPPVWPEAPRATGEATQAGALEARAVGEAAAEDAEVSEVPIEPVLPSAVPPRWEPRALPPRPETREPVQRILHRAQQREQSGDQESADRLYEQAAMAGDLSALIRLARVRAGTEQPRDTEGLFERAMAEHHTGVLFTLAAGGHPGALAALTAMRAQVCGSEPANRSPRPDHRAADNGAAPAPDE